MQRPSPRCKQIAAAHRDADLITLQEEQDAKTKQITELEKEAVKFKENEWTEMVAAAEKQLSVLKNSSKKTIKDGTQVVRSIVGDNLREKNNHMQKMQQIEDKLKKAKEKKEVCVQK